MSDLFLAVYHSIYMDFLPRRGGLAPRGVPALSSYLYRHNHYIFVQPTILNDAPLPLMDAIVVGVPPLSEPISSVSL